MCSVCEASLHALLLFSTFAESSHVDIVRLCNLFPQDLELWIAKERLPDGYNLITRAGRTVQELKVTTDIPLDAMKAAVQTVLRRLV